MRQVIQSRLYAHGYFSVQIGYFVNVAECENLKYLNMIIEGKDDVINKKVLARNRLKEIMGFNGQMLMIPDDNKEMHVAETKTLEEIMMDLEEDAI